MIKLTRLDGELDWLSWVITTHNVYLNLRKGILPTGEEIEKMEKSRDYNFTDPSKPSFIKHPTSEKHREALDIHIEFYRDIIKHIKRNIDNLFKYNQQDDCYDTYKEYGSRNR